MSFHGWPAEALEFYEGLEAENSRNYWQRHRETYDTCVLAPLLALLDELEPRWGQGHVLRPYRDIRFSKDKSLYKTTAAATLAGGGYVQLSADGLLVGAGFYTMARDQLERYRRAVADDDSGRRLGRAITKTERAGPTVHAVRKLKTAPRGYPRDHPRIELLRNRSLYAGQSWPAGPWLGTSEARRRVERALTAARPLQRWLDEFVGDSHEPPAR